MRFAAVRNLIETTTSSAVETIHSVTELIGRIARGFRQIGMVLGLGLPVCLGACQAEPTHRKVEPAVQLPVETKPKVDDDSPRLLGDFNITFYYVTSEDEVEATRKAKAEKLAAKQAAAAALIASFTRTPANDNDNDNDSDSDSDSELASTLQPAEPAAPELVDLYSPECESLAEVSREFASSITLQGTGKLRDGRVINIWGKCSCERSPCFKITANQWGTGGGGRPLQPFRTVAVDPRVVKLGTLLYVPILDGRTMPGRAPWGGFVHDGCVIADDTGGGINDNQLDLFVARKGYYLGVSGSAGSHAWAKHVPVYDGTTRCERKGRKVSRKSGSI